MYLFRFPVVRVVAYHLLKLIFMDKPFLLLMLSKNVEKCLDFIIILPHNIIYIIHMYVIKNEHQTFALPN